MIAEDRRTAREREQALPDFSSYVLYFQCLPGALVSFSPHPHPGEQVFAIEHGERALCCLRTRMALALNIRARAPFTAEKS